MKRVVAILLVFAGSLFAQNAESFSALKRDASKCASAWNERDYPAFVSCLATRCFKTEGDREKAVAEIKKDIDGVKTGFGVESITVTIADSKSISRAAQFLISLVPITTVVRAGQAEFVQDSFALGISDDEGMHWSFIVLYQQSEERVLDLYPELRGHFNFPGPRGGILRPTKPNQ